MCLLHGPILANTLISPRYPRHVRTPTHQRSRWDRHNATRISISWHQCLVYLFHGKGYGYTPSLYHTIFAADDPFPHMRPVYFIQMTGRPPQSYSASSVVGRMALPSNNATYVHTPAVDTLLLLWPVRCRPVATSLLLFLLAVPLFLSLYEGAPDSNARRAWPLVGAAADSFGEPARGCRAGRRGEGGTGGGGARRGAVRAER